MQPDVSGMNLHANIMLAALLVFKFDNQYQIILHATSRRVPCRLHINELVTI